MEAFRLKYSQVMVMIMMVTIISLYIKYSFGPFCSSATGWFLSDERYGCWRVTATGEIVDCAPKVHPEAAHIVKLKPQTGKMIASPQNGCGIALLYVEASCSFVATKPTKSKPATTLFEKHKSKKEKYCWLLETKNGKAAFVCLSGSFSSTGS